MGWLAVAVTDSQPGNRDGAGAANPPAVAEAQPAGHPLTRAAYLALLDVAGVWATGRSSRWTAHRWSPGNNLLAEWNIRYGGYGGLVMRFVSDSYIALFSHLEPCGVWEALYIIDGLLCTESDVQPATIHADTQGQSLPVFGLAALLGFVLLSRIHN